MGEVSRERARESDYVAATNDQNIIHALSVPGWVERIIQRLSGYPDPDSCWQWTGYKVDGYGRAWSPGSHEHRVALTVHRIMWIAHRGPIPQGLVLDHDGPAGCHNRACANPNHLREVTQQINLAAGHFPDGCRRAGHDLTQTSWSSRRCRTCAMEKNQLLRDAARLLGMGFLEYTRLHGWSREAAERVLADRSTT